MKFILKKTICSYLICFLPALACAQPNKILQKIFPCCCQEEDSPPRTPADTELSQRFAIVGAMQNQANRITPRPTLKTKRSDDDISSQRTSQQTLSVPPPSIIEFQEGKTITKTREEASDSDSEWVHVSQAFKGHDA